MAHTPKFVIFALFLFSDVRNVLHVVNFPDIFFGFIVSEKSAKMLELQSSIIFRLSY